MAVPVVDHYSASGRRKKAVARVRIKPGTGRIPDQRSGVGGLLGRPTLQLIVRTPLQVAEVEGRYDVIARVHGGGLAGQAGAVRHGIARALLEVNEEFQQASQGCGIAMRDPRMKESCQIRS